VCFRKLSRSEMQAQFPNCNNSDSLFIRIYIRLSCSRERSTAAHRLYTYYSSTMSGGRELGSLKVLCTKAISRRPKEALAESKVSADTMPHADSFLLIQLQSIVQQQTGLICSTFVQTAKQVSQAFFSKRAQLQIAASRARRAQQQAYANNNHAANQANGSVDLIRIRQLIITDIIEYGGRAELPLPANFFDDSFETLSFKASRINATFIRDVVCLRCPHLQVCCLIAITSHQLQCKPVLSQRLNTASNARLCHYLVVYSILEQY
jgi:hypothetical protein